MAAVAVMRSARCSAAHPRTPCSHCKYSAAAAAAAAAGVMAADRPCDRRRAAACSFDGLSTLRVDGLLTAVEVSGADVALLAPYIRHT